MDSVISHIKDFFKNIWNIVSESEIRKLKITDEYAYKQYDEYLLTKNVHNCLVFSVFQLLIGIIVLIVTIASSDNSGQDSFLKITGAVIFIISALLFIFYYIHELDYNKHYSNRYRIAFYAFWNINIISGFFVSVGYLNGEEAVAPFIFFAAFTFSVPILRLYENIILSVIYAIPIIYYGITLGHNATYFISSFVALCGLFCLNGFKCSYYSSRWINKRKFKDITERCTNISQTDNLTGMLNRTGLSFKFLEKYRNSYGKHKIAVIMADIDNFRYYNHKFGYDRSDACLYNICNCIRIIAKPVTTLVSRFGGDDFIIVLEDMSEVEVVKFAEQIRSTVETMAIPFGDGNIVTISVGVSSITELNNEETYSKLINEADTQLIIAKSNGRNCVGYRNRAFKTEKKKENK